MGSSIELGKSVEGGIAEAVPIGVSPGLQGYWCLLEQVTADLPTALLLRQQPLARAASPAAPQPAQPLYSMAFHIGLELAQAHSNTATPWMRTKPEG
ncbi:hypothetical protein [Pseudomonas reactans]